MIVVEGLDNTGKTTLVSRLCEDFPNLHYRPSIGNKHNMVEIRTQAEAEAYQYRPNVISDRSRIISEYIYNPVLKDRDCAYPVLDWLRFIGYWASRPQCLIYCTRDPQLVTVTFAEDEREQLANVRDHIPQLSAEYERTMEFIRWLFELTRGHFYVEFDFDKAIPPNAETKDPGFDPYVPVFETVRKYLRRMEEL